MKWSGELYLIYWSVDQRKSILDVFANFLTFYRPNNWSMKDCRLINNWNNLISCSLWSDYKRWCNTWVVLHVNDFIQCVLHLFNDSQTEVSSWFWLSRKDCFCSYLVFMFSPTSSDLWSKLSEEQKSFWRSQTFFVTRIMCHVIITDSGRWFSNFCIDKEEKWH